MASLMMSRIASGHSVGMYPWQGIFIQSDKIAFHQIRGMCNNVDNITQLLTSTFPPNPGHSWLVDTIFGGKFLLLLLKCLLNYLHQDQPSEAHISCYYWLSTLVARILTLPTHIRKTICNTRMRAKN